MSTLPNRHVFSFDERDNGGEHLSLITDVEVDERGKVNLNQELVLHSYCNSASFNLSGAVMTPELLRKLANELDEEIASVKAQRVWQKI